MSVQNVNTHNQIHGTVVQIQRGPVVSEVEVETAAGLLSAVITTSSLDAMALRVGDRAVGLFKATNVLIGKIEREGDVHTDS